MRKMFLVLVTALMLAATAATSPVQAQTAASKTITQIAAGNRNLTTLVATLKATGLDAVLNGAGPFTVFAPTNAAFAKLGTATINALLADKAALSNILTYHVVSGTVPASVVVGLQSATTVQGSKVTVKVANGGVFLNGTVRVTTTNIFASNGVIHLIDTVLLPPTGITQQLALFNVDTPVVIDPNGVSTGNTITACQTFFIVGTWQNFGLLRDVGSYVDLRKATIVPATYGQPGGFPKPANCANK